MCRTGSGALPVAVARCGPADTRGYGWLLGTLFVYALKMSNNRPSIGVGRGGVL